MTTLEDALLFGRGTERPFRCPEHDDTHDSASVNVLKAFWYCYACRASGRVDSIKPPSPSDLLVMLEPDRAAREYPRAYLELFNEPGYWLSRFPSWLCWQAQLGEDPLTGDATFPVYTPRGKLAGVGRRKADGQPKYLYPPRWTASAVLHSAPFMRLETYAVMVEGAADAISLWEVGIPAYGCYGSGMHLPQREMLLRSGIKHLLLGFDMDDAGRRAAQRTAELMGQWCTTELCPWPAKDPGDCTPEQRRVAVGTVVGQGYVALWKEAVQRMQTAYLDAVEAP